MKGWILPRQPGESQLQTGPSRSPASPPRFPAQRSQETLKPAREETRRMTISWTSNDSISWLFSPSHSNASGLCPNSARLGRVARAPDVLHGCIQKANHIKRDDLSDGQTKPRFNHTALSYMQTGSSE